MANFWYDEGTRLISNAGLDLDTADIRVMLLSTNTTADTERDKTTIAGFTTKDEFDGVGYTANGQAIAGRSLSVNAGAHRTEVPATASTWTSVSAGTRPIQGALVYLWGGSIGASVPLCFVDTGGFPLTPSGADITITWNAAGLFQVAAA